jgi:MFS family permease
MPGIETKNESENRRRFLLTSVIVALSLLGDALLYALLPSRPEAFGLRVWQVGILLGANRLVRLLTNELAGRLVHRSRSNQPLYWAIIAGSLITASYALPIGFWGLLAARLAWGACWSLFRVEGYLAAQAISSNSTRGRIFAAYQAITRIGQGGGVLVGGLLADTIGITPTFFVFGLGTLSGILFLLKTPTRNPSPQASTSDSQRGAQPFGLWGCALTLTMTEQMVANLTGRLVADRIGPILPLSFGVTSLTGLLLGFRSFGTLVLGPLTGMIGDRFGRRHLLAILIVLQACCIGGIAFFRPWPLMIACLLLQFASGIGVHLLLYTLAGDLAPDGGGALHVSRFSTFLDLGTAIGPIVGFALYAGYGFLWVAALAWLLTIGALVLLRWLAASTQGVYGSSSR